MGSVHTVRVDVSICGLAETLPAVVVAAVVVVVVVAAALRPLVAVARTVARTVARASNGALPPLHRDESSQPLIVSVV